MVPKLRLDQRLVELGLVPSRSQATSWIKLGKVTVNDHVVSKAGALVSQQDKVILQASEQYVSRAGLKLASVAELLRLDFAGKTVLDVGSSTGGFTDYALQHGANKVIAVDVGTEQLHPTLRTDPRVDVHEKTNILNVEADGSNGVEIDSPDLIVMDVSFVSVRDLLPHIVQHIADQDTEVIVMLKPQFEAGRGQVSKGVIKNDRIRRTILQEFEQWARQYFLIRTKADSAVAGANGNRERFYLLEKLK